MKEFAKWLSLCLVLLLTFTITAFAQDEDTTDEEPVVVYDPDDIAGSRNLTSGKLVIGGNGTFGIFGNSLSFEISPFVAYRITDKWLVGAGINYSQTSQRDTYIQYVNNDGIFVDGIGTFRESFFGGRALTRYLLFHVGDPAGVYANAEFQYNRIGFRFDGEKIPYETNTNLETNTVPSMFLGAGYSSNFYQGFGYTIDLMYDVLWNEDTSFSEWPILYRVGVTYGF